VTLQAMVKHIELWLIDRLIPFARDPRTHSDAQIAQIAASIAEFGFNNPILVDTEAGIIAGHGRLLAIDPAVRKWFETEFWPTYPRHEGKQPALRAANKKATTPDRRAFYLGRLKSQLPAYLQRKSESGQSLIPMASTWFNQDLADDELDLCPESNSRGPRAAARDDYPDYIPLSGRAG
jgi:hypothetical protein